MPSSPISPGRATNFASPEKIRSSAETTSTCSVAMIRPRKTVNRPGAGPFPSPAAPPWGAANEVSVGASHSLDRLGLLDGLVDAADHVERLLGKRIAFAVGDHLEAADRFLQRHVLALGAGEHLGDEEGLAEEALDLAGAGDGELVFRRELVHAEDGDDVAQLLVALQDALHLARRLVVLGADDVRVELARGAGERGDRGRDAERGD